jgi:beta-aspartyl-peptidase (threonine type)
VTPVTGIALGLHGGCGTLDRSLLSESDWSESRAHIDAALRAGWSVLTRGGTAVEAVEATVVVLEDSPHFNAGHGAALTADSTHELDASIMDGATLKAGAVAGVCRVRNPVRAARALMDSGLAVMMGGPAADDFARRARLAMVEPSYFTTQRRIEALASLKARAASGTLARASEAEKHGTVGAVARDANGHLAAATSTGGFNNKPPGRIGDSPVIGAGTYAADGVCAVSCTGQGEIFIRCAAAHELASRVRYAGQSVEAASRDLVDNVLGGFGIGAGMIALGATGEPVAPYNTLGMYRGWITTGGLMTVATHHDLHHLGPVT